MASEKLTQDEIGTAYSELYAEVLKNPVSVETQRQELNIKKENEMVEKLQAGELDGLTAAEAFNAIRLHFATCENAKEYVLQIINPSQFFTEDGRAFIYRSDDFNPGNGFRMYNLTALHKEGSQRAVWGADADTVNEYTPELFRHVDEIINKYKNGIVEDAARAIALNTAIVLNMIHPLRDCNGRSTIYWQVWLERKLSGVEKADQCRIWKNCGLRPTESFYTFDGEAAGLYGSQMDLRNEKHVIQNNITKAYIGEGVYPTIQDEGYAIIKQIAETFIERLDYAARDKMYVENLIRGLPSGMAAGYLADLQRLYNEKSFKLNEFKVLSEIKIIEKPDLAPHE